MRFNCFHVLRSISSVTDEKTYTHAQKTTRKCVDAMMVTSPILLKHDVETLYTLFHILIRTRDVITEHSKTSHDSANQTAHESTCTSASSQQHPGKMTSKAETRCDAKCEKHSSLDGVSIKIVQIFSRNSMTDVLKFYGFKKMQLGRRLSYFEFFFFAKFM